MTSTLNKLKRKKTKKGGLLLICCKKFLHKQHGQLGFHFLIFFFKHGKEPNIHIYTYILSEPYIYILICESFMRSRFMGKVFQENHLPWKLAAEPKNFHFFFIEKLEIVNEGFKNNQEKPFITFFLTFGTIYGWECEFLLYIAIVVSWEPYSLPCLCLLLCSVQYSVLI